MLRWRLPTRRLRNRIFSLSYPRALHFDSLKIDKSFIDKLGIDAGAKAIVGAIINLAHTLGVTVVAEGIEQEAQMLDLISMGCDVGQGFHLSRPVDPATVERLWPPASAHLL